MTSRDRIYKLRRGDTRYRSQYYCTYILTLSTPSPYSTVLMVGAGGIGCELLKTLVLSGFKNVSMIDLDTIDVSNLNRQFLFRRKHVGMSKALVAKESAEKFRSNVELQIDAHHGNVKETKFNPEFIKNFDVVLNGLDNLEARKHVNRLCLAAEVPLVESGTTGYLGQVTVHEINKTACFECSPKPVPKSHPICTLRDTPEKPVHCVAFATDLLFPRLFSSQRDKTSDLDEEDAVETGVFSINTANNESYAEFAVRVYEYVFRQKINTLLEKTEMWEKRTPPISLPSFSELMNDQSADTVAAGSDPSLTQKTACEAVIPGYSAQTVLTMENAAKVFVSSIARILTRDNANKNGEKDAAPSGTDKFDKDDALAVDFVSAVTMLRSTNYHIPPSSPFDIKGVAGNIVHAVATTNAIVGGLIVLEAVKILRKKDAMKKGKEIESNECPGRYTFVKQRATNNRLLEPIEPDTPNKSCAVCQSARLELVCDTSKFTLGRLVNDALKKKLGMHAPEIEAPETTLFLTLEDLDDDEAAIYKGNLGKTLSELPAGGVQSGMTLQVSDFSQKFDFDLLIMHKAEWDEEEDPDLFMLRGDSSSIGKEKDDESDKKEDEPSADDDDDLAIIEEGDDLEIVEVPTTKRKRDDAGDETKGKAARK